MRARGTQKSQQHEFQHPSPSQAVEKACRRRMQRLAAPKNLGFLGCCLSGLPFARIRKRLERRRAARAALPAMASVTHVEAAGTTVRIRAATGRGVGIRSCRGVFRIGHMSQSDDSCGASFPSGPDDGEWLEWYALSPQQRFEESAKLWATYLALGGSLDPEPDPQSPFFSAEEWRQISAHGRAGLRGVRRSGV